MNTQNVSTKIAAQKSSERWGSDPKARLGCVIAEQRSYPLVSFHVVQPWLQAKDHAIRLYGVIGREAWEIARKDLCNNINFAQAMMRLEAR